MLRVFAVALMFALAVPTLVMAQEPGGHHPPPGRGGPMRPGPGPGGPPHGPPPGAFRGPPPGAAMRGGPPHGGPVGAQFSYRGHPFNRVHVSPFAYPPGFAYRRWAVGGILPPTFLAPAYYYADWAALGLVAPQPGFQWVRYGPDLLLVDTSSGQVVDVAYGVFY